MAISPQRGGEAKEAENLINSATSATLPLCDKPKFDARPNPDQSVFNHHTFPAALQNALRLFGPSKSSSFSSPRLDLQRSFDLYRLILANHSDHAMSTSFQPNQAKRRFNCGRV